VGGGDTFLTSFRPPNLPGAHRDSSVRRLFFARSKILRDRLNFMFVGLLGEYGKILFAFSPYALSPNQLNTFRVFSP
jgi:hypothetical protein